MLLAMSATAASHARPHLVIRVFQETLTMWVKYNYCRLLVVQFSGGVTKKRKKKRFTINLIQDYNRQQL